MNKILIISIILIGINSIYNTYQIQLLPEKIFILTASKTDTVIKTTTKQLALPFKGGGLLYLEGKIQGNPYKMDDLYEYDPFYPNELYEGYLTKIKSNEDYYYVWSKEKPINQNELIKGYFTNPLNGIFLDENNNELNILFPTLERTKTSLEIP